MAEGMDLVEPGVAVQQQDTTALWQDETTPTMTSSPTVGGGGINMPQPSSLSSTMPSSTNLNSEVATTHSMDNDNELGMRVAEDGTGGDGGSGTASIPFPVRRRARLHQARLQQTRLH